MSSDHVVLATKDFQRSFAIFSNLTSGADCLHYDKIDILIFDEQTITFCVPLKSCAIGHNLSFFIFDNDKKLKNLKKMPNDKSTIKALHLNGKVIEYENFDEGIAEIDFRISDNFLEQWKAFLKKADDRQERATKILKRFRS